MVGAIRPVSGPTFWPAVGGQAGSKRGSRNWSGFRRGSHNLRDRSSDRLIDICAGAGIAFIPWYPLAARGFATPNSRLARIAQSHGARPSQIALAWLLQRSPAMLPIPGTSSIAHLEENLAAASIHLSSNEFQALASL